MAWYTGGMSTSLQTYDELILSNLSGSLSVEQREEANSFERISSLLGILQSRARIVLRDAKR